MDLSRVIQAAAEAALQDQSSGQQPAGKAKDKRKKGLTTPRALLLGAGAFTVGRLFMGSRGRDMLGDLQERLAIYESEHFGSGEPEGDEDLDEEEELDEPEGEYDEDEAPEDEAPEDDEPEDEYDEDEATEDDEPEDEYDEDDEPEDDYDEDDEPEGEYDEDDEPEGEYDEDEDEESEPKRPRQRRTSSAGSHNGRH